jgi:hypothetical protein
LECRDLPCRPPPIAAAAQAVENARTSALPELSEGTMGRIRAIYDDLIRDHVHQRW